MCSVGASWGHEDLPERPRLHHLWLSFPLAPFFPSYSHGAFLFTQALLCPLDNIHASCAVLCSIMSKHVLRLLVVSKSHVRVFCDSYGWQPTRLLCPWGFSRQEYWSGLPCPSPGDLPDPGIEPRSPALQALYHLNSTQVSGILASFLSEPPGKPQNTGVVTYPFSGGSSQPRN